MLRKTYFLYISIHKVNQKSSVTSVFLSLMLFFNSQFEVSESAEPQRSACFTMVDGAAVAAEVGFHQRSLFLALFGPTGP